MALDTRYLPSKYFQEAILDKDTALPLAAGVVTFYEDNSRTTKKSIFQLTGTPPNYTYTALPNPMILSASGTFQDASGNDIIPYFLPYDSSGVLQLYYCTVESSGAVFQFSREGFPNLGPSDVQQETKLENYIPNGQFLLHHNLEADIIHDIAINQVTESVTNIAEGGWTFERPETSTATDFISFERIGSYTDDPTTSPRYYMRVRSVIPDATDAYKDVRIKFKDVNKFASDINIFTLYFEAKSNSGSQSQVIVKLIKNYGTGAASPEDSKTLQAIQVDSDYIAFDIPFVFGANNGKTIGPNNDDFIQLTISFPPALPSDIFLTNFVLTDGDVQITAFPNIPDEDNIRHALAGQLPVPDYDNKNLYLPTRLGEQGLEYDTDCIGEYVLKSHGILSKGELWGDGAKYIVDDYSLDRIPYRRLYEKWAALSTVGLPIYGVGADAMYCVPEQVTDVNNISVFSNHTVYTGWQSFVAGATATLVKFILTTFEGNTQVCTVRIYNGEGVGGEILSQNSNQTIRGDQINTITLEKPVPMIVGQKYTFWFVTHNGPDHGIVMVWSAVNTYPDGQWSTGGDMWFQTEIEGAVANHDLKSTTGGVGVVGAEDSFDEPTGFIFTPVQPDPFIVDILALPALSINPGAYWHYTTTSDVTFDIWFTIDGVGDKPDTPDDVFRKVELISTDDAKTVANKMAKAINSYSMATPYWSASFIRITDDGAGLDPGSSSRLDRGDGITGDNIGTRQTLNLANGVVPIPNIYADIAIKY